MKLPPALITRPIKLLIAVTLAFLAIAWTASHIDAEDID